MPKIRKTLNRDDKLRELLLYVALECEQDGRFGKTKLHKILFYSDFLSFKLHGQSITGQRYQRNKHGPCSRGLVPAVQKMKKSGLCDWAYRDYFGHTQMRLVALVEPNLKPFSAEELELVRRVVKELWDKDGTDVSELSHEFIGWQLAERGEDIPYELALVGEPRPLTESEVEYARELVEADNAQAS